MTTELHPCAALDPDVLYEACECDGEGFCLDCLDEGLVPHDCHE